MSIARANRGKVRQIVNARSHLGTQLVEIGTPISVFHIPHFYALPHVCRVFKYVHALVLTCRSEETNHCGSSVERENAFH